MRKPPRPRDSSHHHRPGGPPDRVTGARFALGISKDGGAPCAWSWPSASAAAPGHAASVRLELQADCLAGVWAYHAERARHVLETGDVEEALGAAAAIGDDRLQRQ